MVHLHYTGTKCQKWSMGCNFFLLRKKNVLKNFLLGLFGHILTKNVVHLLQWYSSGNDKAKTTDGFCKMTGVFGCFLFLLYKIKSQNPEKEHCIFTNK